ncbi:5979_t:CDS:2 [Ambispora gerdemannii]|uniref:5979_t:CDS:1 n=1 Tax=Ambispora gerdemannii TaxID=144530 RepID=A0A9N8ZLK1_9GLOM|nr:5979_t:CDS:2 [Ambispora gerdemannii]
MVKNLQQLPSQQLLQEIQEFIVTRPNHKRLRITEAIGFNPELKHPEPEYQDLYLLRGKRKKDRYVYIAPEIIGILKHHHIELAPHTLRRCFATYNLLAGMPLNILQKFLGHSRVSTTALYIKDSDLANLLKFKPI